MLNVYPVLCRAGSMDNYCYIIQDEATQTAAVVDSSEPAVIIAKCRELGITPQYILNTHHHFDHTDGNLELKEYFGAKVVGNGEDKERIPGIDIEVYPGQTFSLGESTAEIIDVSGHTQGHILWYFPKDKVVFTGDTLFNLSIGGLFEGDVSQMFDALQKIKRLPDDVLFYPGHEYTAHGAGFARQRAGDNAEIMHYLTKAAERLNAGLPAGPFTLREEKACNPYLSADKLEDFSSLF